MKNGKIITILGETASGKNFIMDKLLQSNPSFKRVVTYTDRQPRKGEKDGVDYYFVSKEEMAHMINNGDMLEYSSYNVVGLNGKPDVYTYATHINSFQNDEVDCICILDYEGYKKVQNIYSKRLIGFMVYLDETQRKINYLNRGGNEEEFERRTREDDRKFKEAKEDYSLYHIMNRYDRTDETIEMINDIIKG